MRDENIIKSIISLCCVIIIIIIKKNTRFIGTRVPLRIARACWVVFEESMLHALTILLERLFPRVIQSDRLVSCIIRGVVSKLITTTLGNRSRIIANGNSPISVIVQSQSYVKLLNLHSLIYTLASSNQKIKSKGRRAMEISKTVVVVQIFRFYLRDTR